MALLADRTEGWGVEPFRAEAFFILKICDIFLGRDYADDNDIQQEIAKHLNKKTAEKGEWRPRQRQNSWT